MTDTMETITTRVKRLLALANGTHENGEHERAAALAAAHKLLAKHNLEMSDVESKDDPEEARVMDDVERRDDVWACQVAVSVARLYFCEIFKSRTRKGYSRFTFVGRKGNVATAQGMFDYLVGSVSRESRKTANEAGAVGNTFAYSFCKGAATALYLRCETIRRDAEKPATGDTQETGLVLASVYKKESDANRALMVADGIRLHKKVTHTRNTDRDARALGSAYGSSVGFHKQLK